MLGAIVPQFLRNIKAATTRYASFPAYLKGMSGNRQTYHIVKRSFLKQHIKVFKCFECKFSQEMHFCYLHSANLTRSRLWSEKVQYLYWPRISHIGHSLKWYSLESISCSHAVHCRGKQDVCKSIVTQWRDFELALALASNSWKRGLSDLASVL